MRKHIVLTVSPDYLLSNIKANIMYISHPFNPYKKSINGDSTFFIMNGNIYCAFRNFDTSKCDETYMCCSIIKLRKFLSTTNIKNFILYRRKEQLETIEDLYNAVINCGFTRIIDFWEYREAVKDLKSDFGKRYKFDDFTFVSKPLSFTSRPGDILLQASTYIMKMVIDMISNRRKQAIPECLKEEISYEMNNMLEENAIDITDVQFLLHGIIKFEVIGTLFKKYQLEIVMMDNSGEVELNNKNIYLCDCSNEMEMAVEEYFRNELF